MPLSRSRFLIQAGLGIVTLAGAGSLMAATPVLKVNIDPSVPATVEVSWVSPLQGKNDNCFIKIYEGVFSKTPTGDVDITRSLSFYKEPKNTICDLHPGTWTWTFTGFLASCAPILQIRILDGPGPNPIMRFTAKGNVSSSKITISNDQYSGPYMVNGVSQCFNKEADGSLTVTYPH